MARFVLTAQLQLQAPNNTRQVIGQIRNQLGNQPVQVPVTVKGAAQAQKQIQQVTKATQQATSAAQSLGRSFGLAVKRFAAFTVASRAVSLFTNSLANAVEESISFQREIVKVAQVLKVETDALDGLQRTITRLSTSLGVVSNDLLAVTRILSQAGVRGKDLEVALEGLAKSTLAPTFDDITQTAEGAVAVLAQFRQGVGALEGQLGSINAVAGRFAVESGDLIGAVRRFGGVFKSAGGSLEELLAVFTSVRQTTRESAESISTGLRTIFTRIQRPETIRFLRQLGVELQDAEGRFIGPIRAVEELGKKFSELEQGDLQFIKIAEELGGFRQIGKVIPLIQQYEVALEALDVAKEGRTSLDADAAKAQEALAVQITKVREEFLALVRAITDSSSFQIFTRTALELASALIQIADAVKPLLPLLGGLAAIRFTRGLGGFFAGAGASIRSAGGARGFNQGGFVPGSGNRDTVPAMLTPGEFVIKKSSAAKLGAGTLEAMNNNRFAAGGTVELDPDAIGGFFLRPAQGQERDFTVPKGRTIDIKNPSVLGISAKDAKPGQLVSYVNSLSAKEQAARGLIASPRSSKLKFPENRPQLLKGDTRERVRAEFEKDLQSPDGAGQLSAQQFNVSGKVGGFFVGGDEIKKQGKIAKLVAEQTESGLRNVIGNVAGQLTQFVDIPPINGEERTFESSINNLFGPGGAKDAIEGYVLEGVISAVTNAKLAGGKTAFDYPEASLTGAARERLGALFGSQNKINELVKADAKRTSNSGAFQSIIDKVQQDINRGNTSGVKVLKKAAGGGVPGSTDTVPALLTPGEFVVNKKAAQSIGYGNLASMNRTGVQRFQAGGTVGNTGAASKGGTLINPTSLFALTAVAASAQAAISELGDASAKASDEVAAGTIILEKGLGTLIQLFTILLLTKQARTAIQNWTNATDKAANDQEAASGMVSESAAEFSDKVDKVDTKTVQAKSVVVEGEGAEPVKSPDADVASGQRKEPSLDELAPSLDQIDARIAAFEQQQREQARTVAEPGLLETDQKLRDEQRSVGARRKENKALSQEIVTSKKKQTDAVVEARSLEQTKRKRQSEGASDDELLGLQKRITELITEAGELETVIENNSAKIRENAQANKESADRIAELKDDQKTYSLALKESRANLGPVSKGIDRLTIGAKRLSASLKDRSIVLYQKTVERISSVTKKASNIAGTQLKKFGSGLDSVRKRLGLTEKNFPTFTRGAKRAGQGIRSLTKTVLGAGRGVSTLTKKVRDLAKAARASFGPGGRARAAAGRVANTGAAALGAITAIAAVGSQIASGFEQWFKRAEEQARASDNIAGAIEAAGKASIASSIGEVFTIGGFIEAASDPEGFVERRRQRKETAEFQAAQSFIGPRLQAQLDQLDPTAGASREDRDEAARGTIEAFARTRSELGDLSGDARDKALLDFNKSAREAIKSLDGADVSISELRNTAISLSGADNKLRESLLKQVAAIEEARKVQAELNKANLQSLQITSAFGAANAAVANFAAGLETGSSTLGGYINTLEQAQSGVGVDASAAIDAIEKDLVGSATAAGAGVLADDIRGQAAVARASTGFAAAAGGAVENLQLRANNPEVAKADLKERLRQAIPQGTGKEVEEQITRIIGQNVDSLGDDLSQVDLSEVIAKISQDSQALAKGFFEAAKLQDQHNQAITKLYQEREAIEAKVAESLNKAIDVQLQAAKNFESFGGARLTGDQQLSARIAQFNNVGGLAGVGLRTGNAQDIQRVAAEIGNVFNSSQQTFVNDIVARSTRGGGPGVFAGPGGFQRDQRPEAQRANDQLLKFTQQRILLLREELKIVKAKNQEEKNALDKLISGDIQGFIQGQAAAGAGAALRSGSSGLTSLFSASALGAGFKSLEGQGLTDAQKGRAEQLTLERFGLQSQGILSGTTAEERALNAQGRELSQLEGQLGAQAAQFAKSEIAVNEATIIATNLTFQNELANVARRNANFVPPPPPQGLARGGTVYANRGMFVPRGTDTVPAMLTPGEFVVNRAAVQRGNNLQILRAMNTQGGASSPNAKSGGGRVYYNTGGVVEGISSAFQDSLPALRSVFDGFSQAVDRLANTQFSVKLDTTNVNVNLNGASFLASLKEDIKRELLDEVSREIGKAKPNSSGDLELRKTVL